ncbi:MAG: hypothetical protein Q9166_003088 [cf. Caloplaca sp. 2 TL-2023]
MTTARAASTLARSVRNWADCAVHVKIFPRPANLAESREVLRVLQQYGEVVMYRHLKYDAPNPTLNAALAIYRTRNSAYKVIQASPIHFQLQQGTNGLISKISRDASAEGLFPRTGEESETQVSEISDENLHGTTGDQGLPGEEADNDLSSHPSYSQDESTIPGPGAPNRPGDIWESKFFTRAVEKETQSPTSSNDTPFGTLPSNFEPPGVSSKAPMEKLDKKSTQRLAQQLAAETKLASESPDAQINQHTTNPVREFQLTVVKSFFNHQAYIERQAYYAGFNPDMKTIMAEDLRGRVPLEGLLDCSLKKGDVPLRIRLKRKERNRSQISLRELWETGKKERGEV